MTNDVTSVFGSKVGMMNPEALQEAMAQSAALDPRGAAGEGSDYMNFSGKRGVYEIGLEKRSTTPDELWLVNVPAFEDGWVCWKDNRTVANRLYPLGTPVPPVDTTEHGPFPKSGEGWSKAKSLTARSIDNGQQVYFKINSISGVSVFAALQKEITDRLRTGQPYWPVIGFDKEPFTAQGFSNFKPVIVVDGWLNNDQVMNTLPAAFADENVELDLDAMYKEAVPKIENDTPPANGGGGGTARRNRGRAAL
jgi:hypothetical protein